MTAEYVPPDASSDAFNCPHCGAFAEQIWWQVLLTRAGSPNQQYPDLQLTICRRCQRPIIWLKDWVAYPVVSTAPPAHPDMPDDIKLDYQEASDIVSRSPRAASALLRLAAQKLLKEIGEKGKNIDTDIGSLVRKGLDVDVQKALDVLRVIGNNAVHPGEIDFNEEPETAQALFGVMNLIVERLITQPRQIGALYELIPDGALDHIKERDAGSAPTSPES